MDSVYEFFVGYFELFMTNIVGRVIRICDAIGGIIYQFFAWLFEIFES